MRIRDGSATDIVDVSALSGQVFAPYGDYRQVLPDYLLNKNVHTFVCEYEGRFAGFLQVALEPEGRGRVNPLWADVVAVAVTPELQRQGLGTALFHHAFAVLEPFVPPDGGFEVWLTVAHTNHDAIRLFLRLGFELTGVESGDYAGGQRALRMCRVLLKKDP